MRVRCARCQARGRGGEGRGERGGGDSEGDGPSRRGVRWQGTAAAAAAAKDGGRTGEGGHGPWARAGVEGRGGGR